MKKFFKPAIRRSDRSNLLRTLCQAMVFWIVFLLAIPLFILKLERAGEFIPSFNGVVWLGVLSFLFFSFLNLYSGITMSLLGKGTPLPLESPRQLVVKGPYCYVRNPMAVGGIGQAISIGLILGSYGIIIYAISGAILWHVLVRPEEEKDLQDRFGDQYDIYKDKVGLWWPRSRW